MSAYQLLILYNILRTFAARKLKTNNATKQEQEVKTMTDNFQTRIIIYSVILGVMFAAAIYLAMRHKPDRHKRIIYDEP